MKRALLLASSFLVLLFVVDELRLTVVSYAQSQYVRPAGRPAWLEFFASFEVFVALAYAAMFSLAGAVLAVVAGACGRPLLVASLFGIAYSAVTYLLAPVGWLPVIYSHAPGWLWLLSRAPFYVPCLACLLGALVSVRLCRFAPESLHVA